MAKTIRSQRSIDDSSNRAIGDLFDIGSFDPDENPLHDVSDGVKEGYVFEWGVYENPSKIVCWVPKILDFDNYSEKDLYKIVQLLKQNSKDAWQGPMYTPIGWKFRFNDQEDVLYFKLII